MKPLLSIIIPFYGNADRKQLDACVESVRRQQMDEKNYELIIADDHGKGLGAARNNGMKQARGIYLLFMDADDVLFPDTLSQCFDLLKMYEPDMLSFGYEYISSQTEKPQTNHHFNTEIYISGAEYMVDHNYLGTAWRHFFLREWLEDIDLHFAEGVYHEDEAFIAKAYFMAGTTVITDLVMYGYVQHHASILNSKEQTMQHKRINDFLGQLIELKKYLHTHEASTSELQHKALRRRISFLTIDFFFQLKRNQCSIKQWYNYVHALKKQELLPLPYGPYSTKYTMARSVINSITFLL